MNILIWAFFLSLPLGQLGALPIYPGVTLYVHDLILIVLLTIGFIQAKNLKIPGLIKPITFFIVAGVASLVVNGVRFPPLELAAASLYLVRWGLYSLLYMYIAQKEIKMDIWKKGLWLSGVLMTVVGVSQFIFYPNLRNLFYLGWDPYYFRLFSTFLDPNFTGLILLFSILLSLNFKKLLQKKVYIILISVQAIAFILTFSRSSYLAALGAALTYSILKKNWRPLVVLAILMGTFILIPKPELEALRFNRTDSSIGRIKSWGKGVALVKNAPLLGNGFNTLRFIDKTTARDELARSKAAAGIDNSFLFIWATTGIVGLMAYLWLLWKIITLALSLLRFKKSPALGIVLICTVSAAITHSLFSNSLFYPWVMIWLWVLVGISELSISGASRGAR